MAFPLPGALGKRLRKIDPGFALRLALRRARLGLGAADWPTPRLGGVVRVSPASVRHYQLACPGVPETAAGRFPMTAIGTRIGGDWDRAIARVEDTAIHKGLHQRFVEGRAWDATVLHPDRYRAENPQGRERYSRFSEGEFHARAAALDRLYRSLRAEGWVTHGRKRLAVPLIPDVLICNLTREGRLVRNAGGLHRLILAGLAGLDSVPVILGVVHAQWRGARAFETRTPAPRP